MKCPRPCSTIVFFRLQSPRDSKEQSSSSERILVLFIPHSERIVRKPFPTPSSVTTLCGCFAHNVSLTLPVAHHPSLKYSLQAELFHQTFDDSCFDPNDGVVVSLTLEVSNVGCNFDLLHESIGPVPLLVSSVFQQLSRFVRKKLFRFLELSVSELQVSL